MALSDFPFSILEEGYSFADSDLDVILVQLDGGAPFLRKGKENNSVTVNFGFILNGDVEIAQFFTWYETTLVNGVLPFNIDLILDSDSLTTHKAQFVEGSLSTLWLTDTVMKVLAQVEALPVPLNEDEALDLIELFNEYGPDYEAEFVAFENDLDQIINVDLPGIGI